MTTQPPQGLELSSAFVEAARALQATGALPYEIKSEGDLSTQLCARVPSDIDRSRVRFDVGDAMALAPTLGAYDAILVANVLCRLPAPLDFLRRLVGGGAGPTRAEEGSSDVAGILRPGGLLMLTTPFSWKQEFTPKVR